MQALLYSGTQVLGMYCTDKFIELAYLLLHFNTSNLKNGTNQWRLACEKVIDM